MANTTARNIRIDDELWQAATTKAAEEGDTVSGLIRRFLTAYVKGTAAALLAIAAIFTLTACGSTEAPAASPVESSAPAAASSQAVETASTAVESTAADLPIGQAAPVKDATIKISALEPGVYAVEVYTQGLVEFAGTYTGTDSNGAEHIGDPELDVLRANGVGGQRITFDTTDIVSITYAGQDGVDVTWTVA